MRVELAMDVFSTDDHLEDVNQLLYHFGRGRHQWVVEPEAMTVIEPYFRRTAPTRAATYAALARKAAVYAVYTPRGTRPPVRIGGVEMADYVADLNRPAYVAVENDHSDGCFIRAIATVLGADDILRALDKEWLTVDHGGGQDGVRRRGPALHAKFKRLKRVVALVDSDRMTPDKPGKGDRAAEKLRGTGVVTHVLTFREAENYVPNKILAGGPRSRDRSVRLGYLKRLTATQRGYFDMKHGFRGGKVPDEQMTLYADLPAGVVTGLAEGFGKDILEAFVENAHALDVNDLQRLGPAVHDELQSILAMLREIV